jgi:phospholipase C
MRGLGHGIAIAGIDPPSSILGGEAFLARIYNAYKAMQSPVASNVWNTTLLIGWDEPGGTYDHVAPGPVPPPDPAAPAGQDGFTFDRSGYRVPAVIVSPWVAEGVVFHQEHRHTSLIATLREQWCLGDPFTARDAAARTLSHVFTLDTPRDPQTWPAPDPRPVAQFTEDAAAMGTSISTLGKTLIQGMREYADHNDTKIDGLPEDPNDDVPPEDLLSVLRNFLATIFPLLTPDAPSPSAGA